MNVKWGVVKEVCGECEVFGVKEACSEREVVHSQGIVQ